MGILNKKKNNIPIEDELWFCYYHGYKRKWVLDDDEIEKKSWEEKFFLQNSDHTVFTMNGFALPNAKTSQPICLFKILCKKRIGSTRTKYKSFWCQKT